MEFHVEDSGKGQRLDHFLQGKLPEFSRSRLQEWVKAGRVQVDGAASKASLVLKGGERVDVEPMERPPLRAEAEDLPLDVLYQDDDVVVVNKAAGVVVHDPLLGRSESRMALLGSQTLLDWSLA